MNNEQNNNLNSGISFMSTMGGDTTNNNPSSPVNSNEGGYSVPGANLNPVGGIITPEPIVTTDSITNNTPTMGDNSNNMGNNLGNDLLNSNQNIMPSSPFDIGVSSSSSTSSPILNPTMPAENTNSQPQEMSMKEATMPSTSNLDNSPSNNVPLTNESSTTSTQSLSAGGDTSVVSVGKYLGHMFLFAIPLVGVILLLIKAFGEKNDKNISNYAKAQLIFMVIGVVAGILLSIILSALMASAVAGLAY